MSRKITYNFTMVTHVAIDLTSLQFGYNWDLSHVLWYSALIVALAGITYSASGVECQKLVYRGTNLWRLFLWLFFAFQTYRAQSLESKTLPQYFNVIKCCLGITMSLNAIQINLVEANSILLIFSIPQFCSSDLPRSNTHVEIGTLISIIEMF